MLDKRLNTVSFRLTDEELLLVESLQKTYHSAGVSASKSFLFRYGVKRLINHPVPSIVA
ncbi:MAG: hypothetical protein PHH28_03385 [Desulfuromonadaceae bacterium]|nr:hypothetical protein [Desulfuromonadaceae bacterium]